MKPLNSILVLLVLFASSLAQAEELRIWVATSVKAAFFDQIREPFEKQSGVKLIYPGATDNRGAVDYFRDLLDGKVEAATTSSSYDEWVKAAQKEQLVIPSGISHRTIGRDALKVYIHPGLGLKKLSLEQMQDLVLGKIKNWKEVGGPDQEFILIYSKNKTSTSGSFRKVVTKGQEFNCKFDYAADTFEKVFDKIMSTPGSLGFLPGSLKASAAPIETPPIGRPITLINKGRPSASLQKLIDFLEKDAPKYVGKQ